MDVRFSLHSNLNCSATSCLVPDSNSGLECKLECQRHSHSILNAHSDTLSAREIKSDLSANPPCECVHASIKALHGQESLIHTVTNSHIHIHCMQLTNLRSVSEVWHHITSENLHCGFELLAAFLACHTNAPDVEPKREIIPPEH